MSVSTSKNVEQIWYKDPKDFLSLENAVKFIPDSKMTLNEQLNAAFRFSLYFSIVVAAMRQDARVLFFAVFVGIFTYIVAFQEEQKVKVRENLMEELNIIKDRRKRVCTLPTKDNPYMNVLVTDYKEFPNRPPACNINNKDVKTAISDFSQNVYQDADDVFNRKVNERAFYTVPSTTIPNDQTQFAHWLYNTGATCKEKTIMCQAKY